MTIGDSPDRPRLVVAEVATARAAQLAVDALPRETGGLLLGWYEGLDLVVADIIPVTDPDAGNYHYVRNHDRAQAALRDYLDASTVAAVGYVGEWHSHPLPSPPSATDYESLEGVAHTGGRSAAMIVVAVNHDRTTRQWGAVAAVGERGVVVHDVLVERWEGSI